MKIRIGENEITLPLLRFCLNCGEDADNNNDCCPSADCRIEHIVPELRWCDSQEEPRANDFSSEELLKIANAALNELATVRAERDSLKKRVKELEKALDIANNQERCGQ